MSFSIGKLRIGRDTPKDPEGRMTLVEHLAELRSRLLKAVIALLIGMAVGFYFYDALFNLLVGPLAAAAKEFEAETGIRPRINFGSVAAPLMVMIQVSLVAGLVAAAPIWLYQIWAFIVPGLHRHERKWSLVFLGTATPLFLAGIALGYWALPRGLDVLLGFTPGSPMDNADLVENFISIQEYFSFVVRLLVVFGIAFLIPIFTVMLNVVGVLSSKRLSKWRAPIIFVIFVFAAVATPTLDPFTMLLLAIPMTVLFIASELIARLVERSRRARLKAQGIDIEAIESAGKDDD